MAWRKIPCGRGGRSFEVADEPAPAALHYRAWADPEPAAVPSPFHPSPFNSAEFRHRCSLFSGHGHLSFSAHHYHPTDRFPSADGAPQGRSRRHAKQGRRRRCGRTDTDAGRPSCPSLSLGLVAKIHGRLPFLDRLAFAAAFVEPCKDLFEPEPPCLLLPDKTSDTARLFSLAERRAFSARVPDPAMRERDYLVIGSNHGWLATADDRGQIHLANPTTGAQH
ncbi:uncharacterized protein LOC106865544 [Brachypodium distachyon]|uniref:uncharacterized protein LOC106865544 n=1 Tax=Brachypodium distachyon TaxID=15368 RepID=UPI00071D12F2|nr:uncharacterized protein LOC106865544 [Brachypodium distachyon]|eukprot:XP_014751204.1 uncharacterized protein LOC106865544 [Brachypodium distachyon]